MSLSNSGSFWPYGTWWMNRRIRSHLTVSPIAISSPMTRATARMSKRRGKAGTQVKQLGRRLGRCPDCGKPGSSAAGSRSRRCDANRNASAPFTQKSKVDTAKTAVKRTAFVAKTVQKTPTYQSTRTTPNDHDAAGAPQHYEGGRDDGDCYTDDLPGHVRSLVARFYASD